MFTSILLVLSFGEAFAEKENAIENMNLSEILSNVTTNMGLPGNLTNEAHEHGEDQPFVHYYRDSEQ